VFVLEMLINPKSFDMCYLCGSQWSSSGVQRLEHEAFGRFLTRSWLTRSSNYQVCGYLYWMVIKIV